MKSSIGLSISVSVFAALCVLLLPHTAQADIQLDNTCPFGNNYIQMVGFACIEAEERARNPSYTGAYAERGPLVMKAFTMINRNMNRLGIQVGNITYCSNFTIAHAGCSGDITPGSFARERSAYWAQQADFFFSDFGALLSVPNIMEVNAAQKVISNSLSSTSILFKCDKTFMALGLQPECHVPGDKRFPWQFAAVIPVEADAGPVVTMLKLSGVKTVAVWHHNVTFPKSLPDAVEAYSSYNGLTVLRYVLPKTPQAADFDTLVKKFKADNVDSLVGIASAVDCPQILAAFRRLNWMPKAMFQTYCSGEPAAATATPDAKFIMDIAEFDHRMKGPAWTDDLWYPPDADGTPSSELAYRDLISVFNETPAPSTVMTMVAGLVLHKVLQTQGTLDQHVIRAGIASLSTPTFAGMMGFSTWGQNNVKDVIVLQPDENYTMQIVYPLGTATRTFIYPAPTWDERKFNSTYMHTTAEAVLAIIIGVLIFISVLLLIFLFFYRDHPHIRAASPIFLVAILIGSIMLYCVYFTWTLIGTTATCHLRYWLLGVGFVLTFGALFSKTWRVMRIFTVDHIHVFKISNLQLMAVLAVLVGVEVVLLILFSAVSRPVQLLKVMDPLRASKNLLTCKINTLGSIFLGLLAAYKAIMVGFGIYMSIRIWKIPRKEFNESRSIAFSMYNMLTFGIITFALQASGVIPQQAMFIIRSICISLSTFLTIAAIFGPKISSVITGHTGYSTSTHASDSWHSKGTHRGSRNFTRGSTNGGNSREGSTNEEGYTAGAPGSSKSAATASTGVRLSQDVAELQTQLLVANSEAAKANAKYDKLRKRFLALRKAMEENAAGPNSQPLEELPDSSLDSSSSSSD